VTSNYICFILLITLIIVVDIFVGVVRCNNNICILQKPSQISKFPRKRILFMGKSKKNKCFSQSSHTSCVLFCVSCMCDSFIIPVSL
jgi:hypothetical protein